LTDLKKTVGRGNTYFKSFDFKTMSVPTSENSSEHILSTERLEALADGIFAFAMTLLVLSIDIPVSLPATSADQAILKYLIDLLPKLGIYIIAFLILGMLWYGHQRLFHFINYIDTGLLWINLIFLMFVALAPLTTNLAGDYVNFQMGILPMEIQFLILNLIYGYMWFYVISRPEMLSHELNSLEIARIKAKQNIQISMALVAICISFISTILSLLPIILLLYISISNRYRLIK
jgi:uncharacterized membrane protein